MDTNVLRAVLHSCEDVMNDIENIDDYKQLKEDDSELHLPSEAIIGALCKSLTNLLSYNVSKEAYQRYSVRLHIIDFLRDWCRIASPFDTVNAFTREEYSLKFVERLVKQNITKEILQDCICADPLVPLAKALLCLAQKNPTLRDKTEEIILRISELESTDKSQRLLCDIAKNYVNSGFKQSTIESIYKSQKIKLIEEPLLNSFILSCSSLQQLKNNSDFDDLQTKSLMEQLLSFVCISSKIFTLVSSCMKEMMVYLNYSQTFINFIQCTLKQISEICTNEGKDILDLYPKGVQSCIILLRINPTCHTESSKEFTLESLKEIYLTNRQDLVVLLSHFPEWLEPFSKYIKTEIEQIFVNVKDSQ